MAPIARFVTPGLRHSLPPRTLLAECFNICLSPSRHFSSSPLLRAARQQASKSRKAAAPPTNFTRPQGVPASQGALPQTSYAFVKSLGSKATPTTLYEGPSHFWFYFGCWSSGIGILGWTALTGPGLIHMGDDQPSWVKATYAASYVILCSMGFYLISRTHRIVSLVRVLPGQVASEAGQAPGLKMEVKVKSMLPFVRAKAVTTDTNKARLMSRFSLPEDLVPLLRRQRLEKEREAAKAQHKFDMNHILTMPFRRLGRAMTALFNGTKGAWTDVGFGKMIIDGKVYKIDVTNGFAHDGFRTLEKIVPVQ
ncbi:hypothetical protein LIA77_04684 [Sarocladium implicatum]|nr:hypothetical protein LIA77_04684 [Sarocladium implicatum]